MDTTMTPHKTKRGKMKKTDFRGLFVEQLKNIYWAEKHLHSILPKIIHATTDETLAAAFTEDIKDTEWQIQALEKVFNLMGYTPATKKCYAMEGLLEEVESVIKNTEHDSYTRDAGLIFAIQKIKHYEIAVYGTLRVFARHLDEKEVTHIMGKILDEEIKADFELTKLAERYINELASEE